jgi:DNA polymerase-1
MDAMARLSELNDWDLQPELNIHDDLTWLRVPEKKMDDIAERILDVMLKVTFPWINVPITVEMSTGDNWMELEEVGTFASNTWAKT